MRKLVKFASLWRCGEEIDQVAITLFNRKSFLPSPTIWRGLVVIEYQQLSLRDALYRAFQCYSLTQLIEII